VELSPLDLNTQAQPTNLFKRMTNFRLKYQRKSTTTSTGSTNTYYYGTASTGSSGSTSNECCGRQSCWRA
jgi:hypothetical protein